MCLQAGPALGFDPPERIGITGAGDAIAWAHTIPAFGWYPEVYALFLSADGALRRAAWLGSATTLDDFVTWPDFSLGYLPSDGAAAVMLLICRPGEGVEPSASDLGVFELLRLAHEASRIPLADAVLVDGRRWCSMAARCGT
ncbi:MAG TPA: hypothetical protein VG034_22660 [Acidimicrobiia bacterium]|jgi:hypothetical protein|nr:hypothetical protein [Acidimicrobiia bacterium]